MKKKLSLSLFLVFILVGFVTLNGSDLVSNFVSINTKVIDPSDPTKVDKQEHPGTVSLQLKNGGFESPIVLSSTSVWSPESSNDWKSGQTSNILIRGKGGTLGTSQRLVLTGSDNVYQDMDVSSVEKPRTVSVSYTYYKDNTVGNNNGMTASVYMQSGAPDAGSGFSSTTGLINPGLFGTTTNQASSVASGTVTIPQESIDSDLFRLSF